MTKKELTEIVKIANEEKISKKCEELGYIDCEKDEKLCEIDFILIADGKIKETKLFKDINDDTIEYSGDIITDVKGWENYEFIIININKIHKDKGFSFPLKVLTYAKQV